MLMQSSSRPPPHLLRLSPLPMQPRLPSSPPHRLLKNQCPRLQLNPRQLLRVVRRVAPRGTRKLRRLPVRCPPAAWSCLKPDPARSTPRLPWIQTHPSRLLEACSAENQSLTADPQAAPAATSAPEALPRPANSPADRVPSIPPAARPAVLPETVPAQAHVPVSARVPALRLALAASAARVPAQAALRPPAKRPVRSAPLPAVAAAARSTPKPKKAR
jgi:hypothetical protein